MQNVLNKATEELVTFRIELLMEIAYNTRDTDDIKLAVLDYLEEQLQLQGDESVYDVLIEDTRDESKDDEGYCNYGVFCLEFMIELYKSNNRDMDTLCNNVYTCLMDTLQLQEGERILQASGAWMTEEDFNNY